MQGKKEPMDCWSRAGLSSVAAEAGFAEAAFEWPMDCSQWPEAAETVVAAAVVAGRTGRSRWAEAAGSSLNNLAKGRRFAELEAAVGCRRCSDNQWTEVAAVP